MARDRVDLPRVSPAILGWFSRYTRSYLRRHFHAVRAAQAHCARAVEGRPLIVCLNHPSWWDPLICLILARTLFPNREHYAPIDASALTRYRIFERIGFFGIDPRTAEGAARFLRISTGLLARPQAVLWVTGQGEFADPRIRPIVLRQGIGHVVRRSRGIAVLPLALEYPFWIEKYPEALARFGEPLFIEDGTRKDPRGWAVEIAARLENTQDRLAEDSIARRTASFQTILDGSAGVGGIYDMWRSVRARLRGQKFQRAHGVE